jgi:heme exporter protein D
VHEFFAMGGYALYVWPAYAVFFVVLAWDWLTPALRKRKLIRQLRGRIKREHVRKTRARRRQVEVSA